MRNYEEFLRDLTTAPRWTPRSTKGEFDFVAEISADFPIQVLARLLDVPQENTGQLIDWGNEIIGFSDPELRQGPASSDAESEQYKHLPFRSPVVAGGLRVRARARRGPQGR